MASNILFVADSEFLNQTVLPLVPVAIVISLIIELSHIIKLISQYNNILNKAQTILGLLNDISVNIYSYQYKYLYLMKYSIRGYRLICWLNKSFKNTELKSYCERWSIYIAEFSDGVSAGNIKGIKHCKTFIYETRKILFTVIIPHYKKEIAVLNIHKDKIANFLKGISIIMHFL